MQIVINLSEESYKNIKEQVDKRDYPDMQIGRAIADGIPLTPDILADLLMEERIRGELKQDISYSKDIIDDVRCKLTVDIIDRRPCYCGAELREVWREVRNEYGS